MSDLIATRIVFLNAMHKCNADMCPLPKLLLQHWRHSFTL